MRPELDEYPPGRQSTSTGAGDAEIHDRAGVAGRRCLTGGLAAAAENSAGELSGGQQIAACTVYVVVAVLGVAAPILVMLFGGDRAQKVLNGWKAWLGRNNATVMSVLFSIFGVVGIGQGIGNA